MLCQKSSYQLSELIIINLIIILFIIFGEFILMKFSYNKVHPLAEDINRRIVLQIEYLMEILKV